jgi:nitroreductase
MDVMQAIRIRRSVRHYAPRAIAPATLEHLREALRAAPSACNLQPWHFILVTEPGLRRRVAELCSQQLWMAEASLIVVGCGLPGGAYRHMAGTGNSATIDVAIALDHLTLAAAAEGLGTCWIGAFDEAALKELLHVPADQRIIALMPVGYPAERSLLKPLEESERKPESEIFSQERHRG